MKSFKFGLICLIVVSLSLSLGGTSGSLFSFQPSAQRVQAQSAEQPSYLPIVFKQLPRPQTIFGVEASTSPTATKLDKISNANIYWMRNYAFSWEQIEPVRTTPVTYNWSGVNEAGLIAARQRRIQVIATVKFTPSWAQKVAGHSCGPVASTQLAAFAQFMKALVTRYGFGEFQVKYWEIGNEPDVDPSLVPPDNIYGCWGDKTDPYYGGGYYAQMLKQIYPAIKSVDPNAKVLIGGLLLDCDPTNPPATGCQPGKFFEGILRNQGGPYFDIVNYHGYAFFSNGVIDETNLGKWSARGGTATGKAAFLRSVMASYGVNKPIMNSESSLLCTDTSQCPDGSPPTAAFLDTQADYVVNVFVRAWSVNLLGNIWFEIEGPGWRDCGLLDGSQLPRPAYNAYAFMTAELANATYAGPVTQFTSITGYAFSRPDKRVWVLWSADQTPHDVTVPAGFTQAYDKLGNPLTPAGGLITVKSPVYLELAP